jgi:FixJ family two-component response regulator
MTVRAMKAGAFEFLAKPCREEDLLKGNQPSNRTQPADGTIEECSD